MLRLVFVAMAFLSGAVALSHELLWTRRLIDLLGATQDVTGRVLGLFFLGLSLGGWLATRWNKTNQNSAIRLGIAELSIAVLSLPAIFLPFWADGIVSTMGTEMLVSWQGSVTKAILAAAVVLPPAIGMGTTMPMFIRVITDLGGTIRSGGIWVYSLNMLGGVFGLWFVSTFLLELAGVKGSMIVAAAGNVLIACVSFGLSSLVADAPSSAVANEDAQEASTENNQKELNEADEPVSIGSFKQVFLLAFASGAVVLGSEVLILRMLALISPSSIQTTSALLANVILFLALGSIAVAVLNRFGVTSQKQLVIGVVGAALFCAVCPLILYNFTNELVSVRYLVGLENLTINSIGHYWWLLFTIVAISSGAAMFFFGLVFPSIMSMHSSIDPKGKSVGLLLAINGLGGLLGAEFGNLLLVFQVGIYHGFIVLAALTILVAIAFCFFANQKFTSAVIGISFVFLAILCLQKYQDLRYLSPKATKNYQILNTSFGRDGVLMVVEADKGSRSLLMNNQYILGSSGSSAAASERRQLLVPWLLHPDSEEVCCLGFATGISANGLSDLESPPNVTAIELSQEVADAAREYFGEFNESFFSNPGNQVLVEDARTFMACSNNDYDLIVADLFRPHGVGESRLFSIEHFKNVKNALRSDGLFCQWLPAHQLNMEQFETIAATFLEVFPNTLVVSGGITSRTPSIGLCGWKSDKAWETKDLSEKIVKIREHKGIKDGLTMNAQLLFVGTLDKERLGPKSINTLDNALLEIDAGEFWITKDLRNKRPPDNLKNGFLSGPNWKRFMFDLYLKARPIMNPVHRKHYIEAVK